MSIPIRYNRKNMSWSNKKYTTIDFWKMCCFGIGHNLRWKFLVFDDIAYRQRKWSKIQGIDGPRWFRISFVDLTLWRSYFEIKSNVSTSLIGRFGFEAKRPWFCLISMGWLCRTAYCHYFHTRTQQFTPQCRFVCYLGFYFNSWFSMTRRWFMVLSSCCHFAWICGKWR